MFFRGPKHPVHENRDTLEPKREGIREKIDSMNNIERATAAREAREMANQTILPHLPQNSRRLYIDGVFRGDDKKNIIERTRIGLAEKEILDEIIEKTVQRISRQ